MPGTALCPIYEALVRSERRGGPKLVLARHEGGAGFLADGYARETGKIGVVCSTTGPGATNLITGVACADREHVPMLAITANATLPVFGLGPFQESTSEGTDTTAMLEHCTRYNTLVTHAEQLEHKLAAALITALQLPRGAAHLSIPVDILRGPCGGEPKFPDVASLVGTPSAQVDAQALEKLWHDVDSALTRKRRIVVLVGESAWDAEAEILRFAELSGAAVVTTPRGKYCINPYHKSVHGVFGFSGHVSAYRAMADEGVDLILAVGSDLDEWSTNGYDAVLLNHKLVHIHHTPQFFFRSPMARQHIDAAPQPLFAELSLRLESTRPVPASQPSTPASAPPAPYVPAQIAVRDSSALIAKEKLTPQHMFREITQRFPHGTRFFIDNSNSVPWTLHYFFHPDPKSYQLSVSFASMGWAVGAAVGAAMGARGTPMVCFTGDGCMLMNGSEITVAVQERVPVIFVVLNDCEYGMIRMAHQKAGGKEPIDFSIPPVDFALMAKTLGAEGQTIANVQELAQLDIEALCARQGPTVLNVYVDAEEVPPLGPIKV